jgi:anti-anti-sigma regulatory factor
MEIRREEKGKSIVLHVEGNLIGVAIVQLCKVIEGIQNSDYEHVLLDLGGVRHFDSRVAGGLIYSATILRKRKKKFSLITDFRGRLSAYDFRQNLASFPARSSSSHYTN